MLKKTITYSDYDGNERTEDFYFHLSKPELIELNYGSEGGLEAYVRRIVQTKDNFKLIELFKQLIAKSYGEKSLDGRNFSKSPEILKNFVETEAYSILYMELASDADKAAEFVKKIVPADIQKEINKKDMESTIDNK